MCQLRHDVSSWLLLSWNWPPPHVWHVRKAPDHDHCDEYRSPLPHFCQIQSERLPAASTAWNRWTATFLPGRGRVCLSSLSLTVPEAGDASRKEAPLAEQASKASAVATTMYFMVSRVASF